MHIGASFYIPMGPVNGVPMHIGRYLVNGAARAGWEFTLSEAEGL